MKNTLDKINLQSIIDRAKSKILDLAIRGKLVPQDPADESASVLLERIRAEKEQLIKAGKIKRDKNESYIFRGDDKSYYQDKGGKRLCVEEMIPFDLPQQWLWCQLGEICDYGNCNNTDTATLPDDAWILDLEDIEARWIKAQAVRHNYRVQIGYVTDAELQLMLGDRFNKLAQKVRHEIGRLSTDF